MNYPAKEKQTAGFRPIYFVDSIGRLMRSSGPNQGNFTHPSSVANIPRMGSGDANGTRSRIWTDAQGKDLFVEVNRISTVTPAGEGTRGRGFRQVDGRNGVYRE